MEAGSDFLRQLDEWQRRAAHHFFAYNRAATRCRSLQTSLGASVAILSASVGTSLLATWSVNDETGAVVASAGSFVVAALAAAQAFAAFPQRIADYERAARRFGAIRREIEVLYLALQHDAQLNPIDELHAMRKSLDAIAQDSPNAPRRIWDKTRREMRGEFTHWDRLGAWVRGTGAPQPRSSGSFRPVLSTCSPACPFAPEPEPEAEPEPSTN